MTFFLWDVGMCLDVSDVWVDAGPLMLDAPIVEQKMDFLDTYETQSNVATYAQQYLAKVAANATRRVVFTANSDVSNAGTIITITASGDDETDPTYDYSEGTEQPVSIKVDDIPTYMRRAMKVIDAWRDYLPYDFKTTYAFFYAEDGRLRVKYHVMTLVQQYLWPIAGKRPNWVGIAVDAAILLVLFAILSGIVRRIAHRRWARRSPPQISSGAFQQATPAAL